MFECHKFDIALKDDSLELLLMRDFVFFMDPQLLFIQAKHNIQECRLPRVLPLEYEQL